MNNVTSIQRSTVLTFSVTYVPVYTVPDWRFRVKGVFVSAGWFVVTTKPWGFLTPLDQAETFNSTPRWLKLKTARQVVIMLLIPHSSVERVGTVFENEDRVVMLYLEVRKRKKRSKRMSSLPHGFHLFCVIGIISCLAFSPTSEGLFAAGSYNKTSALYSEHNAELLFVLHGQEGGVTQVLF